MTSNARQIAPAPCPEFDCVECGRHIIVLCGTLPDPRLCGACMTMPGWFRYPDIRAALDPNHDGRDRSVAGDLQR